MHLACADQPECTVDLCSHASEGHERVLGRRDLPKGLAEGCLSVSRQHALAWVEPGGDGVCVRPCKRVWVQRVGCSMAERVEPHEAVVTVSAWVECMANLTSLTVSCCRRPRVVMHSHGHAYACSHA